MITCGSSWPNIQDIRLQGSDLSELVKTGSFWNKVWLSPPPDHATFRKYREKEIIYKITTTGPVSAPIQIIQKLPKGWIRMFYAFHPSIFGKSLIHLRESHSVWNPLSSKHGISLPLFIVCPSVPLIVIWLRPTKYIFCSNRGFRDIKYDILAVCHACHMMIIQHDNLLAHSTSHTLYIYVQFIFLSLIFTNHTWFLTLKTGFLSNPLSPYSPPWFTLDSV